MKHDVHIRANALEPQEVSYVVSNFMNFGPQMA